MPVKVSAAAAKEIHGLLKQLRGARATFNAKFVAGFAEDSDGKELQRLTSMAFRPTASAKIAGVCEYVTDLISNSGRSVALGRVGTHRLAHWGAGDHRRAGRWGHSRVEAVDQRRGRGTWLIVRAVRVVGVGRVVDVR